MQNIDIIIFINFFVGPKVKGVMTNLMEHPHGGGNHQQIGHASTVCRNASPGQKVGLINVRRMGRLRRQAATAASKSRHCCVNGEQGLELQ